MGIYSEYLDQNLTFQQLTAERKNQLSRIAQLRQRDVLVFAADLNKGDAPISISYPDLLPIQDQLANLHGTAIDLILETPGGSGEVAEDIVRLLRDKYASSVAVIVPGWAKSAGTIMTMAANEILMDSFSAVGPIDAQLVWQGKTFSAHALLEGLEKIKREVEETGKLNLAYVPMLQGISPGELQSAENAQKFAGALVREWLAVYKFQPWNTHSSDGRPVTEDEKRERAEEIARVLSDHGRWLTHARSIKLTDLEAMRLKVTDFSKEPELADAIRRYYTLLQMTFSSAIYKLIETPSSQIMRFLSPPSPPVQPQAPGDVAIVEASCGKCQAKLKVQANLGQTHPLQQGCLPYPADNQLQCPDCDNVIDLSDARRQIEAQAGKPVVT